MDYESFQLSIRKLTTTTSKRIAEALHAVDPEGVEARRADLHRKRQDFDSHGPNWCWSIDGHMKLQFFGIELYAAIDVHSRFVRWIYVGVTARTGVSVVCQFLKALEEDGAVIPKFLRSDRGTETMMLATAFWLLHQADRPSSTLEDCFWFGTSTSNQRIEAWWSMLTKGFTNQWKVSIFQTPLRLEILLANDTILLAVLFQRTDWAS
jgi:transposase InsO family protein